jgi:hypothetical protein
MIIKDVAPTCFGIYIYIILCIWMVQSIEYIHLNMHEMDKCEILVKNARFQASTAKKVRSALFFHYLPLKMGSIGCPKTSERNYYYSQRTNPQERSSHLPVEKLILMLN